MTGNTKVWRAPLAGLASLAMVATMGVAAGTANAAVVNAKPNAPVTVSVNGANVRVPLGSNYADVLAQAKIDGHEAGLDADTLLAATAVPTFGGFSTGDGHVDLAATAKAGAKLNSIKVDGKKAVVHFQDEDGNSLGYVNVARGLDGKSVTVPSTLKPNDVADGKILDFADATYTVNGAGAANGNGFKFDEAISLTAYGEDAVNADSVDVTVTVPVKNAWKVNYSNSPSGESDGRTSGDYAVVYAGAIADGNYDRKLTVEVPAPAVGATNATADVEAASKALNVNLNVDRKYGFVEFRDTAGAFKGTVKSDGWEVTPLIKVGYTVNYYVGDDVWQSATVVRGEKAANLKYDKTDKGTFLGWSGTKGSQKADFNFSTGITGDTNLYAVFVNGGNYTVTYKFNDGKTADKTETYLANQVVAEPEAPANEGYLFGGWYEDKDGNGLLTAGDVDFSAKFGTALNANVTLIAYWIKADEATLDAALRYIDGGATSKNPDGLFTDASFSEYVNTYLAVQKDYAQAKNEAVASGKPVSAETISGLVNRLVAGWQNLVFVHEGNQLSNTTVYRLYNSKSGDHFYTQSKRELNTLTNTVAGGFGYNNEGSLFKSAPKLDKYDSTYLDLSDFTKAAGNDANVARTLASIADPVLVKVTRLYNTVNGDHVWSTNDDEVAGLEASADWNNEGAAFYVPRYTGSKSVVRLYNAKLSRHVLSTSAAEQANLAKNGWTVEGTAFKAY